MATSDDADLVRPGPGEGRNERPGHGPGGNASGGDPPGARGRAGGGPQALDPQDPAADPVEGDEEHSRLLKLLRKLHFLGRSLDEAEAWAAGRSGSPGDSGEKAPPSKRCLERARKVITLENIDEHIEREAPG